LEWNASESPKDVIILIIKFINPPFQAMISNDEFFGNWNLMKIIVKPENAFVKKAFPGFCLKSSS
jgi:hypothetical protein